MTIGELVGAVVARIDRIDRIGSRTSPLVPRRGSVRSRAIVPPAALRDWASTAARDAGVDPRLVAAVVRVESNFDPRATSPAGAKGLMQLMPQTARELGVVDPYDPVQNLSGGARYLAQLLARFGGDPVRAVAAYNAGPGAVERYGGVPPFAETRDYVRRVFAAMAAEPRGERPVRGRRLGSGVDPGA